MTFIKKEDFDDFSCPFYVYPKIKKDNKLLKNEKVIILNDGAINKYCEILQSFYIDYNENHTQLTQDDLLNIGKFYEYIANDDLLFEICTENIELKHGKFDITTETITTLCYILLSNLYIKCQEDNIVRKKIIKKYNADINFLINNYGRSEKDIAKIEHISQVRQKKEQIRIKLENSGLLDYLGIDLEKINVKKFDIDKPIRDFFLRPHLSLEDFMQEKQLNIPQKKYFTKHLTDEDIKYIQQLKKME